MHPTKLVSTYDLIVKRAKMTPSPQDYKIPSTFQERDGKVVFSKFPRISYFEEVSKSKLKNPPPDAYSPILPKNKYAPGLNKQKPATFIEHQQWESLNNSSNGDYNPKHTMTE